MAPGSSDFEILESPYKSPHDKKEYRVIKLSNGLTALLISDLHSLSEGDRIESSPNSADISDDDSPVDDEDMDGEEEEDNEDDEGDSSSEDEGDTLDDLSELHHISEIMENEHNNLKKCRKTRYLAASALCIGVGSFEDPSNIQGLMHFLEHMVFMGSGKYPKENCFDNFIKKSGGSDNAHTDYENTTFYFDVQEAHFEKALDIFAQFYICPLMKQEAMQRERKAVHSEFQESVNDDDCRKQQLLASIAKDGHPMSFFTFGNEETLHLQISDAELHSKLHSIRSRFYTAQYMTLSVQAREPLDKLQEMVVRIFSKIPSSVLPRPTYKKYGIPFEQETFHKLYKVIPVHDAHILDISWALPSLLEFYEYKPLHYISHLVGHEGYGSILSYFKKRLWAIDIYAGNDESGYEHNTTYALFHIRIHLTNEGFTHLRDVLLVIFQYFLLLRSIGPIERVFLEIQKMEQLDFDYAEDKNPCENVENISEDMQRFPSKHFLSGSSLLCKYDPGIIERCMTLLQPDSCNIMISSKNYEAEGICNKTEYWFGTKYCSEDIPDDWLDDWKILSPNEELHIPEPNIFIPSNFDIKVKPLDEPPLYPKLIVKDYRGELWFKQDFKFNLPRAYCYVYFFYDCMRTSAKMGAMLDLFLNLYHQQIMEALYPANMAQYETNIKADDWGFVIKVNGFNQKLYKCMEMITSEMKNFTNSLDLEAFEEMKKQQVKCYHNAILCPETLRRDTRLVLLQEVHWQVVEKIRSLQHLTLAEFQAEFSSILLSHKYVRTLIQGNLSVEEAKEIHSLVTEGNISEEDCVCPEMRTRKCSPGEWIARIKGLNPASANTSVVNYYQGDAGCLFSEILNEFVIMAMDEPVFDTLRTKDQLGYHVYCTNRNTYGILGISITVNSQANKYSVSHIDERIESFLKVFSENLKNLSQQEMSSLKDTLKSHKMNVDHTLKEEVDRNWNEIVSGEFLFDRNQQQVELIPKITAQEASQYLSNLVCPFNNPNYRKLSVQIVGSMHPEKGTVPCNEDTLKSSTECFIEHMFPCEEDFKAGKTETQFISNLREFGKRLSYYPVTKIIRRMQCIGL